MSEWKEYKLGEFIKVKHGFAFKGDYIVSDETDKILVTPGNFHIGGGFKSDKFKYYKSEDFPQDYILKSGDIVVTMTDLSKDSDTLGYSAIIPFSKNKKYLHNQRIGLVQFISDKVCPAFVYWLLRTKEYQSYIVGSASGTSIMHTSPSRIENYSCLFPPLDEQRRIAAILSSLDDKIDLLHRENATLEQMAETLFRQWFVMEAKEEWEEGKLGDWVVIKRGGSPRPINDYISSSGYRWLKISDVTNLNSPYIFQTKEYIKESGLQKTVYLNKGSLVLSNSATPGIPKILCVDSCIHDGWLYFPKSSFSKIYLYLLFKYIREDLVNLGNGSIFTNLKTDILKDYKVVKPDSKTLENFDHQVQPIFDKLYSNDIQIQTLIQTRDGLLPRLMSGEVII